MIQKIITTLLNAVGISLFFLVVIPAVLTFAVWVMYHVVTFTTNLLS